MKKIMLFSLIAILLVVTGCNPDVQTGGGEPETSIAENFPAATDGAMPDTIFNEVISPIMDILSSSSTAQVQMQFSQADMTQKTSWANDTGKIVLTMTSTIISDGLISTTSNEFKLEDGRSISSVVKSIAATNNSVDQSYYIDGEKVDLADYSSFYATYIDSLLRECVVASNSATGLLKGTLNNISIEGSPYNIECEAQFSGNKTYEKMSFSPEYHNYTDIEIWNESKIENGAAEYLSAIVRLTSKDETVSTYALTEEQLRNI